MGAYVNPAQGSKEAWLNEHGENVPMDTPFSDIPEDKMAVIHMDNGPFTAAGIAYSKDEFNVFTDRMDTRPKSMFLVPIDKLHSVSLELAMYMKNNA